MKKSGIITSISTSFTGMCELSLNIENDIIKEVLIATTGDTYLRKLAPFLAAYLIEKNLKLIKESWGEVFNEALRDAKIKEKELKYIKYSDDYLKKDADFMISSLIYASSKEKLEIKRNKVYLSDHIININKLMKSLDTETIKESLEKAKEEL